MAGSDPTRRDFDAKIDHACDSFAAAWKAGEHPTIEQYCERLPAGHRAIAIQELLQIECELRRQRGEAPSAADYRGRFPQHHGVVERLFADSASHDADTIAHSPSSMGSGLQIRCPHCSNQVELLVDTPYEEITCRSCGSMFSLVDREDPTQLASPLKKIGRFELISRVGVGGFGAVWKARDSELDRVVAVKIPRRGQLAPGEVEQFFREARAAAQLRHPNIVPVHEVGRENEVIFIVADLVRGVELTDWLTGRTVDSKDAAELGRTIALALQHAHHQGVIHRDLKPSNIMMDERDQPHLMDFGLAKREVGEITMTVDGQILGTPAYMSPEQASGKSHWTDRRTDIYSLGVILYRLLTRELPFRGNAQMQIHQRLTADPPNPRTLNRHVPRDMATICLKCLERDPNRRYATAQAVADELLRFLNGEPIEARPISRVERTIRWARRRPALAVAAALTALLAFAGPLAAWRIDLQRRRLADLVVEKENLIVRYAADQQRSAVDLAAAERRLALWEGKVDPWEFWPPDQRTSPHRLMLQELYDDQSKAVAARLEGSNYDDVQVAQAQLALGYLADSAGKRSEAIVRMASAQRTLERIAADQSEDATLRAALAESHSQLARLLSGQDEEEAVAHLMEAKRLLNELETAGIQPMRRRVQRLDLELRQAVLLGADEASASLASAAAIRRQLSANWPVDPTELYQFVCFLTGRAPCVDSPALPNAEP